ncbi:MAG: hypothetical protein EHM41_02830 [Chloroflexi bacterium]|nr:MAG: hypothetical protein EHM41_02830 [Chloroflexota bacterium]
MHKTTRLFLLAGVLGLAVMLAVGAGILTASKASSAKQVAPIAAPLNLDPILMVGDPLLPTCTLIGTERTCDLFATTGTITLPTGEPVPIWGFTDVDGAQAELPGPVIVANEGETLHIVFHNTLPEFVSLFFVGQEGFVPDLEGVLGNSPKHYRINLNKPGTFLYQAGLTENGARQVAMGLYGGLIVRPVDPVSQLPVLNQAYPGSEVFQKEALLIYSEIDPDFNNDPGGFNMQDFDPEFWLINGKAYPQTEWIGAAAGETVLLRQVNAGLEQRAIGLLGVEQTYIAVDGEPLTYPYKMVSESIGTGQSIDTLVTIDANTVVDTVFPLYETSMHQHNGTQLVPGSNQLAFGGILSFIGVTSSTAVPVEPGPVVTSFTVDPNDTNATTQLSLSGVLEAQGATTLAAYEITIDLPGTMTETAITGTASGTTANINATISPETMANWLGGTVVFYLRGQDNLGNWGQPSSAILNFDIVGPEIYGFKMSPNPANGSKDVHLSGTASELWTGNEEVTTAGASYQGGEIILDPNHVGVVVGLSGDIPAAQIAALAEGQYPVTVWATDFHDNRSEMVAAVLTVDKTGPLADRVTLTPNSLNFSGPLGTTNVRLDAVVTDPVSAGISTELFKVWAHFGDPNQMFEVFPSDGQFDSVSEAVHFNIPVVNFANLGSGTHSVYVVGQDMAGNMGEAGSATIDVFLPNTDALPPVITNLAVNPNPTGGANNVLLTALASDPGLVAEAEWSFNNSTPPGDGTAMVGAFGAVDVPISAQISVAGRQPGNLPIYVRAKDLKGNWSGFYTVILQITRRDRGVILTESFVDPEFTQWDGTVGNVSLTEAAQMPPVGTFALAAVEMGMQATLDGAAPAYLQDNLDGETSYQINFYFDPNSIDMGGGAHQIFTGLNDAEQSLFGIELDEGTSGYILRGWVTTVEGVKYMPDFALNDAPHRLELTWNPNASAILVFSVDNADFVQVSTAETASISGVEASGGNLYIVKFGPSAFDTAAAPQGAEYFDGINAVRQQMETFIFLPMITH